MFGGMAGELMMQLQGVHDGNAQLAQQHDMELSQVIAGMLNQTMNPGVGDMYSEGAAAPALEAGGLPAGEMGMEQDTISAMMMGL